MLKTLIWAESKNTLDLYELKESDNLCDFFFSSFKDTKFSNLKKQYKEYDSSKIIKLNSDKSFSIIFKKNSVWTSITYSDLFYFWVITKNKYEPIKEIKTFEAFCKKRDINLDSKKEISDMILKFYLCEDSLNKFINFYNDTSIITRSITKKCDENLFSDFSKRITSSKQKGIEIKNAISANNNLKLLTKYGEIKIDYSNGEVKIFAIQSIATADFYILNKFTDAIIKNILFNMLGEKQLTNKPKKITKKDILTWSLSFVIVAFMFYITFNFIFNPNNTNAAINILFSKYTWTNIWIYLMSINFIFSLFYGPIITMVVLRIVSEKNKINLKTFYKMVSAGQVRLVVVFLTGNSILASIIWAYYLSSIYKTRVVSLVGVISTMSIIRGIVMIPVGGFFMVYGTIFNNTIFNEMGIQDGYIALITLSWIGWIWHIFHNLFIWLLLIMPPLHILYNKLVELYYGRKGNVDSLITKMTNFENNLVVLKHKSRNMIKDTQRFWRVFLFIIIGIAIETFEFTYGLRIIEDYYAYNNSWFTAGSYWNILQISSARFMTGYVYHVPLLNIIPGQGMGVTDLALKVSTSGIINHSHINEALDSVFIDSLAEQTALVMRFYNFYLRRAFALMTVFWITIVIVYNKIKEYNNEIKNKAQ